MAGKEKTIGIRVEVKQGYHGVELILDSMEEVKNFLDSMIPYMKKDLEIEIEFLKEQEGKEEEKDGE